MDKGEKILKIIEKLKTLEKVEKKYSKAIRHFRFYQIDSLNSLWSKTGQLHVNKIETDLVELWDCILVNTQWSKERIEGAIRAREPDRMERLIHEFNLIRRRLEFESQPEQSKPAETEQKTEPHEKGRQSKGGKVDSPNEKSSETWCWKLYEKTIKAFIAAILDKINPS